MLLMTSTICMAEEEYKERETSTPGDYAYYINDDGTATISSWYGDEEALEIPAEIEGKKVTRVGDCLC